MWEMTEMNNKSERTSCCSICSISNINKKGGIKPLKLNVNNQIKIKNPMIPYLCELALVLAQKQIDYKK